MVKFDQFKVASRRDRSLVDSLMLFGMLSDGLVAHPYSLDHRVDRPWSKRLGAVALSAQADFTLRADYVARTRQR